MRTPWGGYIHRETQNASGQAGQTGVPPPVPACARARVSVCASERLCIGVCSALMNVWCWCGMAREGWSIALLAALGLRR